MDFLEITKLGAAKYFEDHGIYRNPFPNGSQEFNAYERGWMQSLKRDNGRLVSDRSGHFYEKSNECSKLRELPSAADISAERYRSRKG